VKFASFINRRLIVSVSIVLALTVIPAASPASGQPADRLDEALITDTVESLATVVNREYFDPDVAARVAISVRERLAQGRYRNAETVESLAGQLTRDLFEVTKDKHLAVEVIRSTLNSSDEARDVRGRRENFGVQRVEVLAGNVGYLDLTSFYRPEEARDSIAAAMRTLRHTDGLILDMRHNSGGSPGTVALVASYLFDAPGLSLFEIIPRSGGEGRQYATEEPALPDRNGTRPAYVLTAARTFSAGEGLAFMLQERRRAEVVGDVTAGAANPGRSYPVNKRFEVTVPNGHIRTAVTGRNWEGRGVIPDVRVPASEALRVAHIRALRELVKREPSGAWQDTLKRELTRLERPGKR
jgi:C-terminal processing protease CtpA/Prc